MTDDDSDFSPWELKIEFIPRKFIQFTLIIKLLFSFIFIDLGGGVVKWRTYRESTTSFSKLRRRAYTPEYTVVQELNVISLTK